MLERMDRVLLAVRDSAAAAATFARLLGAAPAREVSSAHLNASARVMSLGESEVELWQPSGPGAVQDFLDRWGEGLLAAGYATSRLDELGARIASRGVAHVREDDRVYLPAQATAGFPMVVSRLVANPRTGPVSFLYEATHALDDDWREVAARHADLFALDASRFSPIESKRFGYEGTLTLFDPAARLDRIELSQTFADQPGAMRRFVERRGGNALYMCFAEAHDFDGLKRRLMQAGAAFAARGGDVTSERDGLWVHPKSLHGMLLGVSRASFAWTWSGQPGRVVPL